MRVDFQPSVLLTSFLATSCENQEMRKSADARVLKWMHYEAVNAICIDFVAWRRMESRGKGVTG